jgi:hypothetical protein
MLIVIIAIYHMAQFKKGLVFVGRVMYESLAPYDDGQLSIHIGHANPTWGCCCPDAECTCQYYTANSTSCTFTRCRVMRSGPLQYKVLKFSSVIGFFP